MTEILTGVELQLLGWHSICVPPWHIMMTEAGCENQVWRGGSVDFEKCWPVCRGCHCPSELWHCTRMWETSTLSFLFAFIPSGGVAEGKGVWGAAFREESYLSHSAWVRPLAQGWQISGGLYTDCVAVIFFTCWGEFVQISHFSIPLLLFLFLSKNVNWPLWQQS